MANVTATKILVDGHANAVVQFTGVLDTSNASLSPVLQLSDFTNNSTRLTLIGFQVSKIYYSIGAQLQLQLRWNATAQQMIAALADTGEICYEGAGWLTPNTGAAGFNGAINLETTGWASGIQNYTVLLYMQKLYTR